MPQGRPNSYAGGGFIQSMREKHEPHMKLAGRVEGLEKNIPIEFAQLHKTLSKSFGMQRKTLLRVAALEKQVSGITIIIEGLEDAAADAVKKPPRKKRPRKKKPPKKSAKKPTPKDWDEEVPGDWDSTSGSGDTIPEDEIDGARVVGFNWNGYFITDPFVSECGRVSVNPKKEYGLTDEQIERINDENGLGETIESIEELLKLDRLEEEDVI